MIKVTSVKKMFGENVTAVEDLSFQINKGEIVGFVGQNGAGKTTTIKMLTGILNSTSGEIYINGYNIEKETLKAKQSIGYIADNPDIYLQTTGIEFINLLTNNFII